MIPFTETEKKDPKTGMKPQKTQIAQAFLRKKKKAGGIIFPDVKLLQDYKTQNNMVTQSISSVAQSYPTLCDPMNCSTPGLLVYHQLLEFTQTHVHRVSDAIQPSHSLSSPSPPAPNPSQHQSLFQ